MTSLIADESTILTRLDSTLTENDIEKIRSLSIPGNFKDKFTSLGDSLLRFSKLKQLDVSRNALEVLEGLEHLEQLEKLNAYYNNVERLDELDRLRLNPALRDLDLRLNPVTRLEADYRLYAIHRLPQLVRLDDRDIRDNERRTAALHYGEPETPPPPPPPLRSAMRHAAGGGGTPSRRAVQQQQQQQNGFASPLESDAGADDGPVPPPAAGRTPAVSHRIERSSPRSARSAGGGAVRFDARRDAQALPDGGGAGGGDAGEPPHQQPNPLVFEFCDLADKYWNGSKSLHRNAKFQTLANSTLLRYLDNELSAGRYPAVQVDSGAKRENEKLRARLEAADDEVRHLEQKLGRLEVEQQSARQQQLETHARQSRAESLEVENRRLAGEVEALRGQLHALAHVERLSTMLQESHQAMVKNNEHLLGEAAEQKRRYQSELEELGWSYQQLRAAMQEDRRHSGLAPGGADFDAPAHRSQPSSARRVQNGAK